MKLILDLTGRAGCLICPFCGAGHNDLLGSKIHSNEEPGSKTHVEETSKLANTLEPLQGSSWLLYTQACQLKDKRFDNMGSPPTLGLKRRIVDSIPEIKKCVLEW